jgi:hypothetical protein
LIPSAGFPLLEVIIKQIRPSSSAVEIKLVAGVEMTATPTDPRSPTERRRARVAVVAGVVLAAAALLTPETPVAGQPTPPPTFSTFVPGEEGVFVEASPLHVVFLGYEEGVGAEEIDAGTFAAALPSTVVGFVRNSLFAGVARLAGNVNFLDISLTFADADFEDAFFDHLTSVGVPVELTDAEAAYNVQPSAETTISEPLAIDAIDTERWLGEHLGEIGIDTFEPTVVLINWHSRPDFRFHHYTKTGDPDPETLVDAGTSWPWSTSLIAWGGTAADDVSDPAGAVYRVWFHDLSAGPDAFTVNWELTTPDLDYDGLVDNRLPPVWEYGSTNDYRPFDDLTGDVAAVVRYVAVDSLFFPAPLYKPALSPPLLPESISVDVNRFGPAGGPSSPLDLDAMLAPLPQVAPWYSYSATRGDATIDPRLGTVLDCWLVNNSYEQGTSCYGDRAYGYAYYDLFLWAYDNYNRLVRGDANHHVPVVWFDLAEDPGTPLVGLSDSNFFDYENTQFYVAMITFPEITDSGLGESSILSHEVGHHLGLPHPHDAFDYEQVIQFLPRGDFYFARVGTESSTLMNYLRNEHSFSQFDEDSMGRWTAAMALNEANQIIADIYESPRGHEVDDALHIADLFAGAAVYWYKGESQYRIAASYAMHAYRHVVAAAASIDVQVEPEADPADTKSQALDAYFGDPVPSEQFVERSRRHQPVQVPFPTSWAQHFTSTGWQPVD